MTSGDCINTCPGVCVYLIGSGPGDPDLMTVRGLELLERADIVVHDYLASPLLLSHASPSAEVIYVGKKGFTKHVTQDQINALLIEKARELSARIASESGMASQETAAREGVIVRLKGGDPFVFGRGGEEAQALSEAGVRFEVVPGVTSGIAAPAYAGIPVTQRGLSSSVTFITGNEDPAKNETAIAWDALADLSQKGGTLCFYMGMRNLSLITGELCRRGADDKTPVALVQWGTTARQKTLVSTLENVSRDAEAAGMQAPVMTVIGPVVRMRDKLAWFESRPLLGKRIVVTRSRTQASALVERLRNLGADVIEFPTIEEVSPASYQELDSAIEHLASYDWIVFTSANGVDAFFERLSQNDRDQRTSSTLESRSGNAEVDASQHGARPHDARALAHARIAAIGPATARALARHGIDPDVVPQRYVAESVFDAIAAQGPLAGSRILIPRAQVARETLPELLRGAGATVDVAPAYRTQAPQDAAERASELAEALRRAEVDALTFTSSSTAANLAAILGDGSAELIRESGAKLFSIGPVTSKTLRGLGWNDIVEAKEYTIAGLVTAISEHYQGGDG